MKCDFSLLGKVFKVDNLYYGYDTVSNLLCELDDVSANFLIFGHQVEVPESIKRLQDRGVFKYQNFEQCVVHPDKLPDMVKYDQMHVLPRRFILEITEDCNLRCKYCYNTIGKGKRVHANRKMTEDVAFTAIDYYFKTYTEKFSQVQPAEREIYLNKARPTLSWWGGEPFLNFELIKKTKAYCDQLPWEDFGIQKDKIVYSLTTNLTIFNDDISDFITKNHILLFVSLDGDKYLHDANRVFVNGRGSFDVVKKNLDRLYSIDPEYCLNFVGIHAVYENENILRATKDFFREYMYDVNGHQKFGEIIYIKQSKLKTDVNYSVLKRNKKYLLDSFRKRTEELSSLSEDELKVNIESGEIDVKEYFNLLQIENKLCFDDPHGINRCNRSFSCPIGMDVILVGVNGDIQVCHQSDESLPLGNVKNGGIDIIKLIQCYTDYNKIFQGDCKRCWAFRFCKRCPAEMLSKGKFIEPRKDECAFIRRGVEIELSKYVILLSFEGFYNILKRLAPSFKHEIVYI